VDDHVPIKIYRDSVRHQSGSSQNTHDTNIFQEHAIEETYHPGRVGVVKQANLILNVPPRSHFEANIFETDHLEERELVGHPTQSWKVDGDVVDEDGPDHPDVEVVEGEVLAELSQGVDVSDVDSEMTSGDGVGSSAFLDEISLFSQS
jgi:hypothetical protein